LTPNHCFFRLADLGIIYFYSAVGSLQQHGMIYDLLLINELQLKNIFKRGYEEIRDIKDVYILYTLLEI
jgi:hypothetical protein